MVLLALRIIKIHTWDLLHTLGRQTSLPWLVVGDFNEILCNEEKYGGPRRQAGIMLRFRETMVDCNLEDMGFVGSRFTWSNKYAKERLERGLSSSGWRNLFPHFRVVTLPPSKSDHSPILVEGRTEPFRFVHSKNLFRFEEMWITHVDCPRIIQRGCSQFPTIGW